MAEKYINDLEEQLESPADSDLLITQTATETKKITWGAIWKLIKAKLNIGDADISKIGDGTITGAISGVDDNVGDLSKLPTTDKSSLVAALIEQNSKLVESSDYPGHYYRTVDGTIEWINPPMLPGTAYRTTKRHFGKNVWVQCGTIGALPNTTTMTQALGISGQVFERVLQLEIEAKDPSSSRRYRLPFFTTDGDLRGHAYFTGSRTITIKTYSDLSSYTGYWYVEYTVS